jgi:hypothetical protein
MPTSQIYKSHAGVPNKVAEFIDGKTFAQMKKSDPKLYEKARKEMQNGFVLDALLANWDVMGIYASDNVLIDKNGTPYRIDNGGALNYSGLGNLKPAGAFGNEVTELDKLRDFDVNPSTAEIFHDISNEDIIKQVGNISQNYTKIDKLLPEDLRTKMANRLAYIQKYAVNLEGE